MVEVRKKDHHTMVMQASWAGPGVKIDTVRPSPVRDDPAAREPQSEIDDVSNSSSINSPLPKLEKLERKTS